MIPNAQLALQLYSLKEQALGNPEEMLAMVRDLGYSGIETAGDYGWDFEKWREQLNINRLKLIGAHLVVERLEEELPKLADFNVALGNFHLVVPVPPEGKGADRYHRCAERLNRVAAKAQAHGCHLSYHNHHWEFEPIDGDRVGMDILLAETDPSLVKFQVDTAWALAGGCDLLKFLKLNRARVRCLHAKEYDIEEKNEPTMGEGDVPFPEILEMAVADGWQLTVEHEPGGSAVEGVLASARFLQQALSDVRR